MIAKIQKYPLLFVEFLLLCLIIPGIIIGFKLAPFMFAFLWSAALYGFLIMRRYHWNGFKELWKWDAVTWGNMKPLLIRWVACTIFMYVFIQWYDPGRTFYVVEHRPEIIPGLLVGYPIVSALPQEFVFCSFFFARYAPFFKSGWPMILASAVIFAYAHVLYINPVAPTLGFLAGLIFALTYAKTKSLALVTIEHGLYGNSMFLIGLGWYFYSGSVVQ
ncbi:MAG: CPBP family intramembrane glutamic endopeptidase [Pseudomonadota bacterium]